jgi:hypothetical protein
VVDAHPLVERVEAWVIGDLADGTTVANAGRRSHALFQGSRSLRSVISILSSSQSSTASQNK